MRFFNKGLLKALPAIGSMLLLAHSCTKDKQMMIPVLSPGEIFIKEAEAADTLSYTVSPDKDTIIPMRLRAGLKNGTATATHTINFWVDSTLIGAYRDKYGDAQLLPQRSYSVAWAGGILDEGSGVSQPAEINIIYQRQLKPLTTYVLPVVIENIDGRPLGAADKKVFYLLVKTTESVNISKADWKVVQVSSIQTFPASNMLDNNASTYWSSSLFQPMPQFFVVDMGRLTQFSVLNYDCTANFSFGGTPTSVKIETSEDGIQWNDKGTYAVGVTPMQDLHVGTTIARYFRFTVLAVKPFFSLYSIALISEVGVSL